LEKQASGGEAMKELSDFEWHKRFKGGHENMKDERSGHPRSQRTDENVEKVQILVHSSRHVRINKAYYVEILKWLYETVGGSLNFGPMIGFSTMTMPLLTRCLLSVEQFLDQKLITEMEHP
jgi:hypothetical protein